LAFFCGLSNSLIETRRYGQNLNLDHHLTAQPPTLEFINVLSHVSVPLSATTPGQHPSQHQAKTATPSLKPILDLLSESLGKHPSAEHSVILDDITTLEWIGFELLDVMRFARALRALCVKVCFYLKWEAYQNVIVC
jgi:hypothetical protein